MSKREQEQIGSKLWRWFCNPYAEATEEVDGKVRPRRAATRANVLILLVALALLAIQAVSQQYNNPYIYADTLAEVPAFDGTAYVLLNDNVPVFTPEQIDTGAYEYYSPLDSLGRCGYAMACIGKETMPTEERGNISQVKPTGWVQNQYDFVDGENLYNRCHLIGFQLTGENANERNLITGTRYLNTQGMLPFENMVADYIKETGNHVLYRVTPIFEGDNLLVSGVQMEGLSLEDSGEEICFNVFIYNVQPGVELNYATGENWEDPAA